MATEQTGPRGYHRLADLMGHYPEAAIFRRFGSLNMLNLLSLQAELVDLQVQFRDLCAEDEESTDLEEKGYSTYFRRLRNTENSLQYEMLLKIREKLNQYNAALIQGAQIRRLPAPEEDHVGLLREWLKESDEGGNFLEGSEEYTWNLPKTSPQREHKFLAKDFVTVDAAIGEQDVFSKTLSLSLLDAWTFLKSLRGFFGRDDSTEVEGEQAFQKTIDPESGLLHYKEQNLLKVNNILISVVGAALPIVAIVALYFIKTEGGRIGAMACFTVLFALALAVFTNARRLEIAASTAAFAAVEVVFIGSDLGNRRV